MSDLVLGAITIKTTDIQDNDKIIKFLTPMGVITAKARGVKKADAKLKFTAQPFCFSEITLAKKGAYYTLTGATLFDTFFDLTQNYDAFCSAVSILETAEMYDNTTAGRGMIEVINAFKSLLGGKVKETLVKYLLICTEIAGYKFQTSKCARCKMLLTNKFYFDFDAGCVCSGCAGFNVKELSATAYNALRLIGEADYGVIANYKLNNEALNELLTVLCMAIHQKTDHDIKAVNLIKN